MIFSDISKNLRKENNLSQVQLAERLKLSKACVSMIEIGKNEPTANTLIRYADYFHCTTDYLLGREDDFGNAVTQGSRRTLTAEERKLLETYRALNAKNKARVEAYSQIRLEEQKGSEYSE